MFPQYQSLCATLSVFVIKEHVRNFEVMLDNCNVALHVIILRADVERNRPLRSCGKRKSLQINWSTDELLGTKKFWIFEEILNCVEIKCPTRCNRGFYCRSYCLLNMFRAPLCPSSGAQEYYTVVAACGIWCRGFQVVGLVWSWRLCVRFAGCYFLFEFWIIRDTSCFL